MGQRVFVAVKGRALMEMKCEYCDSDLRIMEDNPNQRIHPIAPESNPWLHSEDSFLLWRKCPNQGKVFEFPCAIEVKQ